MKSTIQISDAEWAVMHALWQAEKALPASEIAKALSETHAWNSKTVRTLIGRLNKKGLLRSVRDKSPLHYAPCYNAAECQKRACDSFLQKVFKGSPMPMLAHMVRHGKLSEKELQDLRDLLNENDD